MITNGQLNPIKHTQRVLASLIHLIGITLISATLTELNQAQALTLNLSQSFIELSVGNMHYNTPDHFFFAHDTYDNVGNVQIVIGTNLNQGKTHVISFEGFLTSLGETTAIRTVNGFVNTASINTTTAGTGIRLGQFIGESLILSTRFGIHYWQVNGERSQTSGNTNIPGPKENEDGVNWYGGLHLSHKLNQHISISAGGQVFPMDIDGQNIHLTNYYLGLGYYF
jgi:hypothetical protein